MKLASLLLLGLCPLLGIGCSNLGERHPASDERVMFRPAGKRVLLGPEVAGVRLGMTEPQVLTEIHNHNLKPWTVAVWCLDYWCMDMKRSLKERPAGRWLVIHRGVGLTLADNGMDSQPVLVEMLVKHGVTLELSRT